MGQEILTADEIHAELKAWTHFGDGCRMARQIEAAVLAKVSADHGQACVAESTARRREREAALLVLSLVEKRALKYTLSGLQLNVREDIDRMYPLPTKAREVKGQHGIYRVTNGTVEIEDIRTTVRRSAFRPVQLMEVEDVPLVADLLQHLVESP